MVMMGGGGKTPFFPPDQVLEHQGTNLNLLSCFDALFPDAKSQKPLFPWCSDPSVLACSSRTRTPPFSRRASCGDATYTLSRRIAAPSNTKVAHGAEQESHFLITVT